MDGLRHLAHVFGNGAHAIAPMGRDYPDSFD